MRQIVAVSIVLFALNSPSYADWEYTSWGMSPEQVLAASAGKASKNDDVEERSTDDAFGLLKAPHNAGKFKFEVIFLFDKVSNKLTTVNLQLMNHNVGHDLHGALMTKYGAPISTQDDEIVGASVWRDEEQNNTISWLRIGTDYFSLQYKPIKSEQTEGL